MDYTVFLLGAGFGTRLRPLTLHRPKPLLPLLGFPMLDYALFWLEKHGHTRVMVNAHHLWEQVARWSEEHNVGLQVELPEILGTGGGLRAARERLAEKFLIWNGDIVSDVQPNILLEQCPEDGAAMALRYSSHLGKTTPLFQGKTGEVIRIGSLCATEDAPELGTQKEGLHFTGIHAMSQKSLDYIEEGFQCVVRSSYTKLVPQQKVQGVIHEGTWFDTGIPKEYFDANMKALKGEVFLSFDPWEHARSREEGSFVHKKAIVEGSIQECIVGAGAYVPKDTQLTRCVIWDGVEVPPGVHKDGIFYDGGFLSIEVEENEV